MRKIFGKIRSFFKCFGVKTPEIKDNTFIVWEPCSNSHSEVVPGLEVEQIFLQTLEKVEKYNIVENKLSFMNANGEILAVFNLKK